jgi:hypothetical protein
MTRRARPAWLAVLLAGLAVLPVLAGYKARPWSLREPDTYPAKLTSEGVTIAVEALFRDTLAAQVFDKNDIITRGIMPIAVVVFNDNDFPVLVSSETIELINGEEHIHTLLPHEVVARIFAKGKKNVWIPQPLPRMPSGDRSNPEALSDFEHKFLGEKLVEPRARAGGFLYVHLPTGKDPAAYLSEARLYIPDVYRQDKGERMIFFEIDFKPAIDKASTPQARP